MVAVAVAYRSFLCSYLKLTSLPQVPAHLIRASMKKPISIQNIRIIVAFDLHCYSVCATGAK